MKNKDKKNIVVEENEIEATAENIEVDTKIEKKEVSKQIKKKKVKITVFVKLIWQTSALNVKYEWWIIEMKRNQPVEIDKDFYMNYLSKTHWKRIVLV